MSRGRGEVYKREGREGGGEREGEREGERGGERERVCVGVCVVVCWWCVWVGDGKERQCNTRGLSEGRGTSTQASAQHSLRLLVNM